MNTSSKLCAFCTNDISSAHPNRRYCSSKCNNSARYKRTGIRSSPEKRAGWYKNRKSKPGYVQKLRLQGNMRNKKVKEFLSAYKLKIGCVDCGYNKHHCALDFDHVKGTKKINVCFSKSVAQAKKEIEKCEVVCSNCHRIRTYNRIYPVKPDIFEATYEEVIDDTKTSI